MEIKRVSMKDYSSLKIGGEGSVVFASNLVDIVNACMYATSHELVISVLGEGTNTYFSNNLSKYLFIKNEIKGISFEEKDDYIFLTASAGEKWDDIVAFSTSHSLWGIENLSFIPGTAGSAPIQNIGAYGAELKDVLVSLLAYDTKTSQTVEIDNEACAFGYRDSLFKQEKNRYVIISITLKLSKNPKPVLTYKPLDTLLGKENLRVEDVRNLVIETRKAKLPDYKEYPNTGSFFKNPVVTGAQSEALRAKYPDIPLMPHNGNFKIPAAWLIEHIAQMKGVRMGNVGTWPAQPLVIVNYADATYEELETLVKVITDKVFEATGVTLEKEVNFIR
jgi:UDP-N-acetylmuramate dehydrogenase